MSFCLHECGRCLRASRKTFAKKLYSATNSSEICILLLGKTAMGPLSLPAFVVVLVEVFMFLSAASSTYSEYCVVKNHELNDMCKDPQVNGKPELVNCVTVRAWGMPGQQFVAGTLSRFGNVNGDILSGVIKFIEVNLLLACILSVVLLPFFSFKLIKRGALGLERLAVAAICLAFPTSGGSLPKLHYGELSMVKVHP